MEEDAYKQNPDGDHKEGQGDWCASNMTGRHTRRSRKINMLKQKKGKNPTPLLILGQRDEHVKTVKDKISTSLLILGPWILNNP
jgi:hypothetical protein